MRLGPAELWSTSVRLHGRGRPRLARVIKMVNYVLFKTILPPEATMTAVPNLMHLGLGVVVHPTTRFGSGVTLAQHVTIAASPPDASGEVHPVILEDDVFVGAGAVLIARKGPLRIGTGAVVGAGAVVVRDVRPGSRVFGNPAQEAQR